MQRCGKTGEIRCNFGFLVACQAHGIQCEWHAYTLRRRIVAVRYDDVMTSSIACYGVNGTSIAKSHCQLAAALIKLHNGQPNPGKVPEWKKNSSNHKGVKDTLYYYNDMIVCCAFGGMLATKRFFRTISTPINDNNGIRGANQPMKYPQNQGISV